MTPSGRRQASRSLRRPCTSLTHFRLSLVNIRQSCSVVRQPRRFQSTRLLCLWNILGHVSTDHALQPGGAGWTIPLSLCWVGRCQIYITRLTIYKVPVDQSSLCFPGLDRCSGFRVEFMCGHRAGHRSHPRRQVWNTSSRL